MPQNIDYVKGRLEGLFELVSILRETVHEGGDEKIVERLVEHIYAEIEEILGTLGAHPNPPVPKEKIIVAKKKIEEAKAAPMPPKEKVVKSYDVLSELLGSGQQ